MASIQRRGRVWRVQVARAGQRLNRTFDTRSEAEAWAAEAEAGIAGGGVATAVTAADLFRRYAREVSPGKRGKRWELLRLNALARDPVFQQPVGLVDGAALAGWRDRRLGQVAASTVAREMNLLGAVFTRARKEWRLAGLNPVHEIQRPRSPSARSRRVSDAERDAICTALGWDRRSAPVTGQQWTAWCFCFAIETAMRKGEILGLTWRHVHTDWCHLPMTKNGDAADVPLSTRARALLGLLERGQGAVVPVAAGSLDTLFRRARDKAGIVDMHFHDSRREGTTRLAPLMGDALELARVTRHKSIRELMGYYRPSVGDLAKKLGY